MLVLTAQKQKDQVAPDTQAAEDGLVGHQREERTLVLERLDATV